MTTSNHPALARVIQIAAYGFWAVGLVALGAILGKAYP